MADQQAGAEQQQEQGQGQERQIQLRETSVPTHYANFFTVTAGQDAAMLNFGNAFGGGNVITLETKLVLSLRNAKRLAMSLGQLVREYEKQHGEIEVGQHRPPVQPEQQQ